MALVFLAFAGMETTRNQLGLALQTFCAIRSSGRCSPRDPSSGGRAVEEVMRVNPTVTWVTREADRATSTWTACTSRPAASCRCCPTPPAPIPGRWEIDPGFDITVESRPVHVGFGGGVHHCLGHFVARTDMSVALPLLARRMPDIEADGPGEWLPVSGNTGPSGSRCGSRQKLCPEAVEGLTGGIADPPAAGVPSR